MWEPLPLRQLHFRTHLSNCKCRCRFCCLGNYDKHDLPFEKYERLVEGYKDYCESHGVKLRSYVYNSLEYPQLKEHILLCQRIGMPVSRWGYFDINGSKMRSGEELKSWINHLVECGMKMAGFSWFGRGQSHDSFVHRNGYYDYLMDAAAALREAGVPVKSKIFLYPEIVDDCEMLFRDVQRVSEIVQFGMIEYTGYAKGIPELFLDPVTFESLPKIIKAKYGDTFQDTFKTEHDWIKCVRNRAQPRFTHLDYVVYVDDTNYDWLQAKSPEELIAELERLDRRIRDSYTSVSELAGKYGNNDGYLLMEWRDVIRKWLDQHFKNEGRDPQDLFSLTSLSVEWKINEMLYTNGSYHA